MIRFSKIACASMVAFSLNGMSEARGAADPSPIRVLCEDTRLMVLCEELAQALADRQTTHPVEVTDAAGTQTSAHLTLRFVTQRFSDNVLAGHLVWSDGAGRSGTGAEIDLTVLDAQIDEEMMREYARQLVNFTELPL